MKIIADTHCHTLASGHAYSTLTENVKAAKEKGLYAVAVTDHTGDMPGAPHKWYLGCMHMIPRELYGVKILRGAEVNIIDKNGTLDVEEDLLVCLDWVVASMHDFVSPMYNDVDACTNAWLNVAKNPHVNVIGHSGVEHYKYDYERVIPEFGRNGKLVEINNSSFKIRKTAAENCKTIAKLCKKYNVPVILNSDAHFHANIGNVDSSIKLLEEIGFPEELIVNANIDRFNDYLKKYTNYFIYE